MNPGGSVPWPRSTAYCAGVSVCFHSASVFCTGKLLSAIARPLGNSSGPRRRAPRILQSDHALGDRHGSAGCTGGDAGPRAGVRGALRRAAPPVAHAGRRRPHTRPSRARGAGSTLRPSGSGLRAPGFRPASELHPSRRCRRCRSRTHLAHLWIAGAERRRIGRDRARFCLTPAPRIPAAVARPATPGSASHLILRPPRA